MTSTEHLENGVDPQPELKLSEIADEDEGELRLSRNRAIGEHDGGGIQLMLPYDAKD